ncbi:MAG: nucleotidyltransferase [Clostridiales bacterium]|jgi:NDP-sugar pyrophosphorylase family protein|uniref:nucleotidyltransferase n=1 Tax=Chordicoccus furentiruminis TaxID=2709410 RepID=UPI0023A7B563|nr:nucleotidyltransferase [Chordicoccus furentiruminis]MCI6172800.1 nucleotidyltransferase [Clostridiales bacterium]
MKKTSLVVMAAGIGSRYGGGIKQMETLGPSGEIMMDYSIHDALEAGFNRVVFIIRRDLDADFRERIGNRIEKVTEVAYAYQEIEDLPAGYRVPQGRMKPWGTGQALLAAKDQIHEPFAVVNADDYYGKHGFRILHDALVSGEPVENGKHNVSMAAFVLGNTLSDNGGVTRGILEVENGQLTGINETKNIVRTDGGAGVMTGDGVRPLDADSLVSMNMWGLYPDFLDELEHGFPKFLDGLGEDALKKEYLLPDIIDRMLKAGKAAVHVFRTDDVWFGVTYREDRDAVRAAFADLIEKGVYRTPLF